MFKLIVGVKCNTQTKWLPVKPQQHGELMQKITREKSSWSQTSFYGPMLGHDDFCWLRVQSPIMMIPFLPAEYADKHICALLMKWLLIIFWGIGIVRSIEMEYGVLATVNAYLYLGECHDSRI